MRWDIPVEPSADEAREWAERELAGSTYQPGGTSWLDSFLDWFSDLFGNTTSATGTKAIITLILVIAILAMLIVAAVYVNGTVRRSPAARSAQVFDDDSRTAAEMRKAAEAAAKAGDWNLAVVERFRALVRALEERTILDELPGRTAHEAASAAGYALPALANRLGEASESFDLVMYGDITADASAYRAMQECDAVVAASKPNLVTA